MAKGKTKKQATPSGEPEAKTESPPDTPEEPPAPRAPASPYDKEPEAGGGALVFLAIVGVLLGLAVVVGFLQGS